MTANTHAFNNDFLISRNGEINHEFIRWSAGQRAIAASDTGKASPSDIRFWEEKLTGMAEMSRSRFQRDASALLVQRLAVSALVGQCETVAASGNLTEPAEQSLRLLIAKTLVAFDMPSQSELQAAE